MINDLRIVMIISVFSKSLDCIRLPRVSKKMKRDA